jgi:hypothetical protein
MGMKILPGVIKVSIFGTGSLFLRSKLRIPLRVGVMIEVLSGGWQYPPDFQFLPPKILVAFLVLR